MFSIKIDLISINFFDKKLQLKGKFCLLKNLMAESREKMFLKNKFCAKKFQMDGKNIFFCTPKV